MKTLKEVAVGQTVTVKKLLLVRFCKASYHGYGNYKRCWYVRKVAPLGDPRSNSKRI